MFDQVARIYDLIYSDKDYDAECDLIEAVFKKYDKEVRDILDVGCGTGNHSLRLSKRGYSLSSIDPSPSMLKAFEEKISNDDILIENFCAHDFWFAEHRFDAAICMFSTLNYVIETDRIIASLKNIRKHLKKGGLFLFDFWYGPAVLHIRPSEKHKIMKKDEKMVIRVVTPELNTEKNIQISHYRFIVLIHGCVFNDFEETHTLRFFFPDEITQFLQETGFKILSFSEFMNLSSPPNEETWDAMIVAEAI